MKDWKKQKEEEQKGNMELNVIFYINSYKLYNLFCKKIKTLKLYQNVKSKHMIYRITYT